VVESGCSCGAGQLHLRQPRKECTQNGRNEEPRFLDVSAIPGERSIHLRVPSGGFQSDEYAGVWAAKLHRQRSELWRGHINPEFTTGASIRVESSLLMAFRINAFAVRLAREESTLGHIEDSGVTQYPPLRTCRGIGLRPSRRGSPQTNPKLPIQPRSRFDGSVRCGARTELGQSAE